MSETAAPPAVKPRKRVQDRWWWPWFVVVCVLFSGVVWEGFGLLDMISDGLAWFSGVLDGAERVSCEAANLADC